MKTSLSSQRTLAAVFSLVAASILFASAVLAQVAPAKNVARPAKRVAAQKTFTNPIIEHDSGDPFMTRRGGFYYLTFTTGKSVEIWQSRHMTNWSQARKKVVWRPAKTGISSREIWAPEVHWIENRWYVYFTATSDDAPHISDHRRRVFVLESKTADALGEYSERGPIEPPNANYYAIDGTILERENRRYLLWSGREPATINAQNIYIAPLSNPWTASGPRVRLSTPDLAWERHGWPVNEGPAVLKRNRRLFVAYSASGGTTPEYALGLLELRGDDPLVASHWRKWPSPVFAAHAEPDGATYTVGHGAFVTSPDGREIWNIYHGKDNRDGTWAGRTVRADIVRWRADGIPEFGHPTPRGVSIFLPSGEKMARIK